MKVLNTIFSLFALFTSFKILLTLKALRMLVAPPRLILVLKERAMLIREPITITKSNTFHPSLKYLPPRDVILMAASKVKIAENP
eukprot:CAMPEP_0170553844 /NCGR_PEP_ID=MMETSP0211-20121228/11674_1 /TAXON_ID=311385 /ORGANISM="Pseudokeronopsis sp., Strain OXSARD2" /LENGTH=84 /DNA_ID=CAMNT_0010862441 /DNA_START=1679 /DNA_END=1933 /DNA_ORIENTATION=-